MIAQGDLVEDWKGRVGIVIGPCEGPKTEEMDASLARVVGHWVGPLRWWSIALFSGSIVKSPEPATESLGPAKDTVVEWAIRRADPSVADQLSSLRQEGPHQPLSS